MALDYVRDAVIKHGDGNPYACHDEALNAIAARLHPTTPNRRDGRPEFFTNEHMRVLIESTLDAVDARAGIADHFVDDD